jgi:peptide/nickel transport system substrate-binding protein
MLFRILAGLLVLALPLSALAQDKVLRAVMHADVRVIDPVWTTQTIANIHGALVYDTLFGNDADQKPQPQMVGKYEISPDRLHYSFTLRDGLKFHDGSPVTTRDVIASLKRWGAKDGVGQRLMGYVTEMKAVDDKTFTMDLREPYGMVLESLGKSGSSIAAIMREKEALTDPQQQVKESIGSGPFVFAKDQWVPGSKAVFVKNTDYVPRKEAPSFASGGKVAKVDRVEWLYIPDAATAAAALNAGEADWWEQPPADLVPVLSANKDVAVATVDPLGNMGVLRFNHRLPPFDNVKMRQAVLNLVDQKDYMRAVAGDEKYWKACPSIFICGGTPFETTAGADVLLKGPNPAKAKQLIKEAGYKGERIVLMSATDQPIVHQQALVTAEALRGAGLNIELQANDWGTLITRRASKEPIDKGGWNLFHTWTAAPDMLSPALNIPLRANGDKAWFGWPTDPKLEELIDAWFKASDPAAQKKFADEIQTEAYTEVPYVPTGQFVVPTAYRKNLDGIIIAPVVFLWNVDKK